MRIYAALLTLLVTCFAAALPAQLAISDAAPDRYDATTLTAETATAAKDGLLKEYAGPLAECAEVKAFRESLPKLRTESIARQRARLGLPKDFEPRVLVALCDAPEKWDGEHMTTGAVTINEREYAVIEVYAPALISRRCDAPTSFEHEVNHALLREYLGSQTYLAIPVWLREGLAQHCAGQTRSRLELELCSRVFEARTLAEAARAVEAVCDGQDDPFDFADYSEAALWAEFLAGRSKDALVNVVAALKSGKPWKEALGLAADSSWNDFKAQAKAYARRTAYAAENGAYEQAFKLLETVRASSPASTDARKTELTTVLSTLEALLPTAAQPGAPGGYTYALLTYTHARCLCELNMHERAVGRLNKLLEQDGGLAVSSLTGEAFRLLAGAAFAEGNASTARETATRVRYGFAYDNARKQWASEFVAQLDAAGATKSADGVKDAGE